MSRKKSENTDQNDEHDTYDIQDLIKAPVEAPDKQFKESKAFTENPHVAMYFGAGILLVLIGIIVMIFMNLGFGFFILLAGAVPIAVAVFAPIR